MKKVPQKMFTVLCNEGQTDDDYTVFGDTAADALDSAEGNGDEVYLVAEYKLVRSFRARLETKMVRRVVEISPK